MNTESVNSEIDENGYNINQSGVGIIGFFIIILVVYWLYKSLNTSWTGYFYPDRENLLEYSKSPK